MRSRATRELGLERIGAATRFLAVGAVVAGGILTAAVAKTLPGRSTHTTSSNTVSPPATSPNYGDDSGQGINNAPLNPPVQSPVQSNNPPVVSSGGS